MVYAGENAEHSEGNLISYPVAASQDIEKGDFVKPNAAGTYIEVCAATDAALGVAAASIKTDASRNVIDSASNILIGVTADLAVQEVGMIWAKVVTTNELKIGDSVELSAVDTVDIKAAGEKVGVVKEYKVALSTPTNGTGYLAILLSPGYR